MLKKRLIPVLLLRNGIIVQSKGFKRYQNLGTPTAAVERLSSWASDELIYLDISQNPEYDLRRDDLNHPQLGSIVEIVNLIAAKCYMPLTFGGGIRTIEDIRVRLGGGADKVTINTLALESPEFITEAAEQFGSQCIVVSIDVKQTESGKRVYKGGRTPTEWEPIQWAKEVASLGAGEILLNSIDRDGSGSGYDLELVESVSRAVHVPVIAMGGAGNLTHVADAMNSSVSAVAVANMFHYTENSVYNAKKFLYEQKLNVRNPGQLNKENRNL